MASISLTKFGLFTQKHGLLLICIYNVTGIWVFSVDLPDGLERKKKKTTTTGHVKTSPSCKLEIISSQKIANFYKRAKKSP